MTPEMIDELLELCQVVEEKNDRRFVTASELESGSRVHQPHLIDDRNGFQISSVLQAACEQEWIRKDKEHYVMTERGRLRASDVVRRHRLAEKLFTDVMALPYQQSEAAACKFEHVLSEEVTNSVCSFLGHPPVCPHGKPIPRGACCRRFIREVEPIVMPCTELAPGEEGKIVFISSSHPHRLQKLSTLGITPGSPIRLVQKYPSIVIGVGETRIAMDTDVVSEIYVRKKGINGAPER